MRAILISMGALELSTGRWLLALLLAVLFVVTVLALDLRIVDRMERFRAVTSFNSGRQETTTVVVQLSLFAIPLAAAYGHGRSDELSPLPEPARPQHLDGTSGGTACPL